MSWKEEFDKKSEEENYWMNQDGTITHTTGMSIKETKQFISDLRKKDEVELIKRLPEKETINDEDLIIQSDDYSMANVKNFGNKIVDDIKQRIKSYYKE